MRISTLSVRDIRSIVAADITLARHFTFITGPNGAGKTNLLEGVHLLATLRPLTTSVPQELVRHGSALASVEGVLDGGVLPLGVRVAVERGRRRAFVGGKPLRDADAYLGTVPTVAFTPDDMRLVKEGPGARRGFVARCSVELWPAARDELKRLDRSLKQRAAALKRNAAGPVLQALEAPLIQAAVQVWRRRERTVDAVRPHAQRWLAGLLGGKSLGMTLVPGVDERTLPIFAELDDAHRATTLEAMLERSIDEDRRRATTSFGPHHDEIELTLDGTDARKFASQGQQRCVSLALTLGVVDAVHQARATAPLVLLDDVSSELDEGRRTALFAALADAGCQVVATGTDVGLMPLPAGFQGEVRHYGAHAGTFEALEFPGGNLGSG